MSADWSFSLMNIDRATRTGHTHDRRARHDDGCVRGDAVTATREDLRSGRVATEVKSHDFSICSGRSCGWWHRCLNWNRTTCTLLDEVPQHRHGPWSACMVFEASDTRPRHRYDAVRGGTRRGGYTPPVPQHTRRLCCRVLCVVWTRIYSE